MTYFVARIIQLAQILRMPDFYTVESLCREFSIEIIPANRYPMPGQTRAVATIRRIINKRGEDHARLVLSALAETRGNAAVIDETSLWAISDIFRACSDIVEGATSDLLDLFDDLPLGPYMAIANEMRGFVNQRAALVGMVYLHVRRLLDGPALCKEASQNKLRNAGESEREKGRKFAVAAGSVRSRRRSRSAGS